MNGRVLIIDDDLLIGRLLERLLDGYEVRRVERAIEAVMLIADGERFDCILCDVCMPKVNGVETLRAIREIDPEQGERLIFVTAYGPAATTVSRVTRRPILEKPFRVQHLRELVAERVAASLGGLSWSPDEKTIS